MEKARELVEELTTGKEADEVSRLSFPPHRPFTDPSFYEFFAYRGLRPIVVNSDFITCTFRVPLRLLDKNGNLAMSAITSLIDVLGATSAYQRNQSKNVSVDMSISCISAAKLDDDLEIESRCLGQQRGYFGTHVVIRNKTTGEIVAEGRHSLFDTATKSKLPATVPTTAAFLTQYIYLPPECVWLQNTCVAGQVETGVEISTALL